MERKKIISQGSLLEFKYDGDDEDRYYLPARGLILPGDYHFIPEKQDLLTYWQQLNEILLELSLSKKEAIVIPDSDYLLDLAILQNLVTVQKSLSKQISYRIYPYAITDDTFNWINKLKRQGYNIEAAFPQKVYFKNLSHPSHRGGWGRWVDKPDQESFPERHNLSYPKSWIGQGIDQIKEAYQRVVEETYSYDVFFKPIFSAGGFTLRHISSEEDLINHYQKLKQKNTLDFEGEEIPVEIQAFVPDISSLYSFQYTEHGLFTPGGVCRQIVENNQWQGNIFNQDVLVGDVEELNMIWQRFYNGYKKEYYPNGNFGWGGIDLAKTEDGKWVILEHNGLRITGAHPAIYLAWQLDVFNRPFATKKLPGEDVNCDLKTLWDLLSANDLSFDPKTKNGIMPIVWFPGAGMLWATGEEPLRMLDQAYNLLSINNYIKS